MDDGSGFRDLIAAHPVFDQAVPVALTAAWAVFGRALVPTAAETRVQLYVAAATVAALVLAAATFVCALVYQSGSEYSVRVRARYAGQMRRNWTSIMLSSLFAALLPIVAIVLDEHDALVASSLSVFALALVTVRFVRTAWWLRFVLLVQREIDQRPTPYVVRGEGARVS